MNNASTGSAMTVTRTSYGLRLSQHGVVISELRTDPGPTHSVFDLLAALLVELAPAGRVGLMGFAGGGMMAPLQALRYAPVIDAVDLDEPSWRLYLEHCPNWADRVRWHHGDAADWLRRQRPGFDLLLDDLSMPEQGDVFKPRISWEVLPGLMARKLGRGGVAVFNLMLSPGQTWKEQLAGFSATYPEARVVVLEEFENRLLIAGSRLPTAAALSRNLGRQLRQLSSSQAGRFRVRSLTA